MGIESRPMCARSIDLAVASVAQLYSRKRCLTWCLITWGVDKIEAGHALCLAFLAVESIDTVVVELMAVKIATTSAFRFVLKIVSNLIG